MVVYIYDNVFVVHQVAESVIDLPFMESPLGWLICATKLSTYKLCMLLRRTLHEIEEGGMMEYFMFYLDYILRFDNLNKEYPPKETIHKKVLLNLMTLEHEEI